MKILVVDDEALLVKGIKFNLENEGYEVDVCYDGQTAVEMASDYLCVTCPLSGPDGAAQHPGALLALVRLAISVYTSSVRRSVATSNRCSMVCSSVAAHRSSKKSLHSLTSFSCRIVS